MAFNPDTPICAITLMDSIAYIAEINWESNTELLLELVAKRDLIDKIRLLKYEHFKGNPTVKEENY